MMLCNRLACVFVVVAAVFAVAGCGDSGGSGEDGDTADRINPDERVGLGDEGKVDPASDKPPSIEKQDSPDKLSEFDEKTKREIEWMRGHPDELSAYTDEVLASKSPAAIRRAVVSLAVLRSDEAEAELFKILLSDQDPMIKLLTACAFCWTDDPTHRIFIPVGKFGSDTYVTAIEDETLLSVLRLEWQYAQDERLKAGLLKLLSLSAGDSDVTADLLWGWILEGCDKEEVMSRAELLGAGLKANAVMQARTAAELLDTKKPLFSRIAAAVVLCEKDVETNAEIAAIVSDAVGGEGGDELMKIVARYGVNPVEDWKVLKFSQLNEIFKESSAPRELRKRALREMQRRRAKPKPARPSFPSMGGW